MIIVRTVVVTDPLARANVVAALTGPGGPAGLSCTAGAQTIEVTFDSERTAPALIDALIEVESTFVPRLDAWPAGSAAAVALAARGLNEPDLDRTRLIETYVP